MLVRAIFLIVTPLHLGSCDLGAWEHVSAVLTRHENPYVVTPLLNWPPFWMQVIWTMSQVASLGIPFYLVVKCILIAAECLLVACLYRVLRDLFRVAEPGWYCIAWVALHPAAWTQSCQHGNFDVLVGLTVLLFMWALARWNCCRDDRDWLLACLALGVGIWIKTVPLVLSPLLLCGWRDLRGTTRAIGLWLLVAPVAIAMSIIFVLDPPAVIAHVLVYRSAPGMFGISGIVRIVAGQSAMDVYVRWIPTIGLAAVGLWAVTIYRRSTISTRGLLASCLTVLLLVQVAGPGYGAQYVYWAWPLVVCWAATCRTRWLVVSVFAITAATYMMEYGCGAATGSFLHTSPQPIRHWANQVTRLLVTPAGMTWVRMPLALAYLAIVLDPLMGDRAQRRRDAEMQRASESDLSASAPLRENSGGHA